MTIDTIAERNKRIRELEAEVERQRRIMAGCAAVIDTLPAGDDEDLAISLDRLSSRLRGFPNAE